MQYNMCYQFPGMRNPPKDLLHELHITQNITENITQTQWVVLHVLCAPLPIANRSPAEGRGAKPPWTSGSLDKSGKLARWDFSSFRTTVTFSSLDLYSCKKEGKDERKEGKKREVGRREEGKEGREGGREERMKG